MVNTYSARDLTFWTDRLPALSGLAKRFLVKDSESRQQRILAKQPIVKRPNGLHPRSRVNNRPRRSGRLVVADPDPTATGIKKNFNEIDLGTYLAGNWSNHLMRCLCWYSDSLPRRRLNTATAYVAPSWSWASVSGAAHFMDTSPCAEIISACCYPAGPDNEGQITGGELILKAKILPARLFRSEWIPEYRYYGATKCEGFQADVQDPVTGKWEDAGPYHPDFIEPINEARYMENFRFESDSDLLTKFDGDYFAMPLAESLGFILKAVQTQETNTFECIGLIGRVGFGDGNVTRWVWELPKPLFENVEAQIIKII
ncbi:hypothetical protein THARTR1_02303 [Trichoderma harzianum]|uniref:Uncharacterized protein n=1 Tax=Trichoderma harzianum TaxID=5544 RepID=A0A2K0UK65_TRIHA|nr:hypothetical protein THARTR1_02303 [Trichoderma harzianum]